MGNSAPAKEPSQTFIPFFNVTETFETGPVILLPDDEIIRAQLASIASARLLPHQEVQCFVSMFKVEPWGYNFETNGFVDLAYMARLTARDLEMMHLLDKEIQNQILVAGMILNAEPIVQQINRSRAIPMSQNAQDAIKAIMKFRQNYKAQLPPVLLQNPPTILHHHQQIPNPIQQIPPQMAPIPPPSYFPSPMAPPVSYPPMPHEHELPPYGMPPPSSIMPQTSFNPIQTLPVAVPVPTYTPTPPGYPPVQHSPSPPSYQHVAPPHISAPAPVAPQQHMPPPSNIPAPATSFTPILPQGHLQPSVVHPQANGGHVPTTVPTPKPAPAPIKQEEPKMSSFTPVSAPLPSKKELPQEEPRVIQPPEPSKESSKEPAPEEESWLKRLFSPSKSTKEPLKEEGVELLEPCRPAKNIFQESLGSDYESSGEEEFQNEQYQSTSLFVPMGPKPGAKLSNSDEEAIESLCDLGYERDDVVKAYILNARDEMAAMKWLADH